MKNTPSPSHPLIIERSIIVSLDGRAENDASKLFGSSFNTEKTLHQLYSEYVERAEIVWSSSGTTQIQRGVLKAFYMLRLAGYLRLLLSEKNQLPWLDTIEDTAENLLESHSTSEMKILEISGMTHGAFILPHRVKEETSDRIGKIIH